MNCYFRQIIFYRDYKFLGLCVADSHSTYFSAKRLEGIVILIFASLKLIEIVFPDIC